MTTSPTAADVMTRFPQTCDASSPVAEAVRIFREADCGAVPVTRDGVVAGVLTDRDVALALANYDAPGALLSAPVGEITGPAVDVETVPADAPIDHILARFAEGAVRRLVVVGPNGGVDGIIAWADVARFARDAPFGRSVAKVVEPS